MMKIAVLRGLNRELEQKLEDLSDTDKNYRWMTIVFHDALQKVQKDRIYMESILKNRVADLECANARWHEKAKKYSHKLSEHISLSDFDVLQNENRLLRSENGAILEKLSLLQQKSILCHDLEQEKHQLREQNAKLS